MKKLMNLTIVYQNEIAKDIYRLVLRHCQPLFIEPGQFINILINGSYLRRPLSVCDVNINEVTVIYKVVGQGTKALTSYQANQQLNCLIPCGHGFELTTNSEVCVIGGGVGIPPLYYLTKKLIESNNKVHVILGFNSKDQQFLVEEFKELTPYVQICSVGHQGVVTDLMDKSLPYYTCGPLGMLKAVHSLSEVEGQLSFEERMGCGFGACMGCSHKTQVGYKRICVYGPVLHSKEVVWND